MPADSMEAGALFALTAAARLTTGAICIHCRLHDDDGDTLLPRMPDVSAMTAAVAPAYVVPVYDVGDDNERAVRVEYDANY